MTNIALVVLDTLRKDSFDKHFDWLPGRRFEHAFSTANWTVPAHASLFSGLYPSEVGVHAKNIYCDCDESTLAEQLQANGYTTRAFSANTNITSHFNFDRGFEDFRTPEEFDKFNDDRIFDFPKFSRENNGSGVWRYISAVREIAKSDADLVPSLIVGANYVFGDQEPVKYGGGIEALEEIKCTDFGDQEFLFLNVMEAHEPYRAPREYLTVEEPGLTGSVGDLSFTNDTKGKIKQAYDGCSRYLSDIYGSIFKKLQEEFDYIITVSDHGEMLGEYDAWGHEHGVYPQLTHIPLCISGAGLDGTVEKTVGLIDVHRTILDIADIDEYRRGKTLLGDVASSARLTEYIGLTSWSKRKLERNEYGEEIEKYDESLHGIAIDDGYYGFETTKGYVEHGESEATSGRERLDSLVATLETKQVATDNDVPDEVKSRLKDLGYA
jgi:arylsulfatase A-like enzyme